MNEESVGISKRVRKLSEKASNAAKRLKAGNNNTSSTNKNLVTLRNSANGLSFRGSVYTSVPPIQPTFESRLLPSVALSAYDKAVQLSLSDDQLICYGCEVSEIF